MIDEIKECAKVFVISFMVTYAALCTAFMTAIILMAWVK